MTVARVQQVPVDLQAAYRHLAVAVRMLADSEQPDLSCEAQYTLAYDAARNAITAVLRASGRRATGGSRSHVVTFVEVDAMRAPAQAVIDGASRYVDRQAGD